MNEILAIKFGSRGNIPGNGFVERSGLCSFCKLLEAMNVEIKLLCSMAWELWNNGIICEWPYARMRTGVVRPSGVNRGNQWWYLSAREEPASERSNARSVGRSLVRSSGTQRSIEDVRRRLRGILKPKEARVWRRRCWILKETSFLAVAGA